MSSNNNLLGAAAAGTGPSAGGLLTSALLGQSRSTPPTSHPPTPPRTPKSFLSYDSKPTVPPAAHHHQKSSSIPPLLSLASIQEQMMASTKSSLASPNNILTAQMTKPLTNGSNPLNLNLSGSDRTGSGLTSPSGIPAHILAAQRAGILPGSKTNSQDYTRYFKRFGTPMECGSYYCKDMNYREHFHCTVMMCKERVSYLIAHETNVKFVSSETLRKY